MAIKRSTKSRGTPSRKPATSVAVRHVDVMSKPQMVPGNRYVGWLCKNRSCGALIAVALPPAGSKVAEREFESSIDGAQMSPDCGDEDLYREIRDLDVDEDSLLIGGADLLRAGGRADVPSAQAHPAARHASCHRSGAGRCPRTHQLRRPGNHSTINRRSPRTSAMAVFRALPTRCCSLTARSSFRMQVVRIGGD